MAAGRRFGFPSQQDEIELVSDIYIYIYIYTHIYSIYSIYIFSPTKIGPARAKTFIPCGQTDGSNMTKLAVSFHKYFVKEHKNGEFNIFESLQRSYCINLKIYKYLFSLPIMLATFKWQGPGWITQPSDARANMVTFPEIFFSSAQHPHRFLCSLLGNTGDTRTPIVHCRLAVTFRRTSVSWNVCMAGHLSPRRQFLKRRVF